MLTPLFSVPGEMLLGAGMRADWREPRRWDRVWRDRPGFFTPGCYACDCGPCAGTTVQFTDDFGSDPGGYTASGCGQSQNYGISGGTLTNSFGGAPYTGTGGVYTQAITIPALSGLVICVQSTLLVITGKNTGTTGITMGLVAAMYGRYRTPTPFSTPYATDLSPLASGCSPSGTSHTYGTADTNFSPGDVIKLVLRDVSSGGGTYDVESYVNGTLMDTHSAVSISLTAGNTMEIGVSDTNGGEWNDLEISTT